MKGGLLIVCIIYTYSRLYVYSPEDLRNKFQPNDIPQSYANFGVIPYGSNIIGRMYYSTTNRDACKEYNETIDLTGDPDPDISPFILADRGSCSFVTKARNIQKWGGRIAVIINQKSIDSPDKIIMIDDGTADDIAIPTILISKESGDVLKSFHRRTEETKEIILLGLEFKLEAPDNRVEYDLYYSLGNLKGYQIMKDFKNYHKRLGEHALFTPHLALPDIGYYNMEECLFSGKYCIPVTDPVGVKNLGKELLYEAVRQICIYKSVANVNNGLAFWNYITEILEECQGNFSASCSLKVYNSIGSKKS